MLKIIEIGPRLPLLFMGHFFQSLGHKIIRIENSLYPDPFIQAHNSIFHHWYQLLNKEKEIHTFEGIDDSTIENFEYDFIISSVPLKLKNQKLIFSLQSSKTKRPLHDIQALSELNLLQLHCKQFKEKIIPPPFLPTTGLFFATSACCHCLESFYLKKTGTQKLYFDELIRPLKEFLPLNISEAEHAGKWPSYQIYHHSDNRYIALALLEPIHWKAFNDAFNLNLDEDLKINPKRKSELQQIISSLDWKELTQKIKENKLCLTPIFL